MKSHASRIVECLVACMGALCFASALQNAVAQESANVPYMNPQLSPEQRATDLVRRMTLAEKASEMQNNSAAVPRLNIPAYQWWSEALHGVINEGVTEYPEPIGLAATFDPPGIHTMAAQIGIEGRIKHVQNVREGHTGIMGGLDFWSPNLNIFRDPRWGRGQETYGEDPFLTGRMGVAYVTGLQGNDPKYYLAIATPKHFAVHSGPEPTRHFADVDVSKHDQVDTYEPAFRAAIVEGKAGSIMCAYNAINGQPACANQYLLQDHCVGNGASKDTSSPTVTPSETSPPIIATAQLRPKAPRSPLSAVWITSASRSPRGSANRSTKRISMPFNKDTCPKASSTRH